MDGCEILCLVDKARTFEFVFTINRMWIDMLWIHIDTHDYNTTLEIVCSLNHIYKPAV